MNLTVLRSLARSPLYHQGRVLSALILFGVASTSVGVARAEGAGQLGSQHLLRDTIVYVDILDPAEDPVFVGDGTVDVSAPDGTALGTFASGEPVDTGGLTGPYQFTFSDDQRGDWDIAVLGQGEAGGRLYSYEWLMDAEDWTESVSFAGSFFTLVGDDAGSFNGVIEFKADGLAGNQWQFAANRRGVNGEDAGRSVPENASTYSPEYPIYLAPPSIASYAIVTPEVTELALTLEDGPCAAVAPGYIGGSFTFTSTDPGTYHLICDLDGDSIYDLSTNQDLAISGDAVAGQNTVYWDGRNNAGQPTEAGSYSCQVTVSLGEFHFVASDVETSYPGFRLYSLTEEGGRTPLAMRWNDALVQSADVFMPNGELGAESSGPDGMVSSPASDAAKPNDGARSWGDFTQKSKGNVSLLDTFSWLEASTSGTIDLIVVDSVIDANKDGVPDGCQEGFYHGGCSTSNRGGAAGLGLAGLAFAALFTRVGRRRRA